MSPFEPEPDQEPEELYGILLRDHRCSLAEIGDMTDYQIAHVVGKMPLPLVVERNRRRRAERQPLNPDPRQGFADMICQAGHCTREQALAEYDRVFGSNGR